MLKYQLSIKGIEKYFNGPWAATCPAISFLATNCTNGHKWNRIAILCSWIFVLFVVNRNWLRSNLYGFIFWSLKTRKNTNKLPRYFVFVKFCDLWLYKNDGHPIYPGLYYLATNCTNGHKWNRYAIFIREIRAIRG
jgi:hypothetical protein